MPSRASLMLMFVLTSFAVACGPSREQRQSAQDDVRDPEESRGAETEEAYETAQNSLSTVDEYEVGKASYVLFRQHNWPTFTILHMDVRSGRVETADAVVVLGTAGGEATAQGEAENLVKEALETIDDRGLCIVRGWLDGQRYVAAIPAECPEAVRDELDGILQDFDAMTGGAAVWILRFEQGLLQSKQRL